MSSIVQISAAYIQHRKAKSGYTRISANHETIPTSQNLIIKMRTRTVLLAVLM